MNDSPAQIAPEFTTTTGKAFTVTVLTATGLFTQPLASVPVTEYY